MTSSAVRAQTSTIGLGNGASPEVYTTIANLTNVSLSGVQANDIDVTDLSSTSREFLQGLEDAGEVNIEGYYDQTNTQHQTLRDAVGSNTASNYRITMSDAETIEFSARVSNWSMSMEVDGAIGVSMTLKVDNAYTFST